MKTIVFCSLCFCVCSSVLAGGGEKRIPDKELPTITGGQFGLVVTPALRHGIPACVVNNSTCPGRDPCTGDAETQIDAAANLDCLGTSDFDDECSPQGFMGICVSWQPCAIDAEFGQCAPHPGGGDRRAYAACNDNTGNYP